MATQNVTLELGTIYTYGPIEQVDGNGDTLDPQNSDYGNPNCVSSDSTVVAVSQTPGATNTFILTPLKVGTCSLTAAATSSTTGDVSPVQQLTNITVAGPQAEGLNGPITANPAS